MIRVAAAERRSIRTTGSGGVGEFDTFDYEQGGDDDVEV